jgi:hypothetical protein
MTLKTLAALICILIAACSPSSAPTPSSVTPSQAPLGAPSVLSFPVNDAFMTVNGEAVDRALVLAYARERGFDANDPAQLKQAADKLAEFVAIAQAGLSAPDAQSPEAALERVKTSAASYMARVSSQPPLTDADVEADYQRQIQAAGGVQVNLAQITLSELQAAQIVQAALAAGKPFSAVMAEMKGAPGVQEVRDIGWTSVIALPEPLRAPVLALQPSVPGGTGGTTPSPLALGGAYYFFNVVESRAFTPPPFAQVKDGLRTAMEQNRVREKIAQIKAQAKIELR